MSNVQSTKKTPQIRFKGFNEEWTQKKYTETFDTSVSNNTFSRAELTTEKTSTQNVHYGDILIKYNSVLDVKNEDIPYIPEGVKIDSKNLLKNGDIVFADTAEDETCGKATEINNIDNEKLVSGLHTFVARPKTKFESQYLGYFINSPAYHNQLLPLMQGIKVTSISKTSIQKTWISYPTQTEQIKIGKLFSQIDSLIASTQKEHDKLVTLKKCMLQKMFPKKGSLVPEIRFKGFTGDWEERRISEYIETITERNGNSKDRVVLSVSNKLGLILQTDLFGGYQIASVDQSNYKVLRKNEFAYNPARINVGSIAKLEKYEIGILSPMYELFKTNDRLSPDFFIYYFQTHDFYWNMNNSLSGSVRQSLALDALKLFIFKVPSFVEQQKIGSYFQNLDNLISKQATELEKLKNIKKTLLSKMFV